MPKDEFDFDDPLELNGVGIVCEEDTTEAMTECFIEEFMRLGHNHKQILAMFRNPHYLGMNMVVQNRGEQFVRDYIAEVFARWGRTVTWAGSTNQPLTPAPAPSDGAREKHRQSAGETGTVVVRGKAVEETGAGGNSGERTVLFPRPLGGREDQGENSPKARVAPCAPEPGRGQPVPEYQVGTSCPHPKVHGEGATGAQIQAIPVPEQLVELDGTVTDPMGAAIPKLNF